MKFRSSLAALALAAFGVGAVAASAEDVVLQNAGFEEGDFTSWKRLEPGGGHWEVYQAISGRRGGGGVDETPPEGDFAARTQQDGPGLNILHRVITKRPGVNTISFQLAYSTGSIVPRKHFKFRCPDGGGVGPLDRRGGVNPGDKCANQQMRVDLLRVKADLKSLKPNDILARLFRTRKSSPTAKDWTLIEANLKELGIKAKRVRLRIAEVDNTGGFFVGVDDLKQTTE